uniref:IF rod domain-containing protein n=1 Tax=Eptatretus burgeri TaxID=7764 RepID=A0A8C4Q308_EPTBU
MGDRRSLSMRSKTSQYRSTGGSSGGGGGGGMRQSSRGGTSIRLGKGSSVSGFSNRRGASSMSMSGMSNHRASRSALKAAYCGGGGGGMAGGITRSIGALNLHSTVPPNINMDVVPIRKNEKEQIKGLNDKFATFIGKVQQLEQQKQVLEAQWRALQQRGGASVNVDGMFQSYINSLKQQLEGLGQDKMRLHGELQQMQGLVEDFKSKYEEEINNRTQKENEFVVVKKDVDDAYLAKVELEAKLDGLQDEIKFLKDIYAEEISQLEQQIKDTSLFVSVDTTRNLNVADIINESQRHYDDIAESSKREASRFYQEKLNEQVSCAPSGEDDIRKCRSEINELNQSMQHMKAEIENLKKRRANLEAQIAEAEEQGDVQIAETKAQITELEKDLHKCKDDMAAQLKEYHALMNVKLALDIEIATYRSLLEQEENRINSISYGGGGGGGGGGLFGGIGGGIGGIGGLGGLGGGIGGFGGSLGGSGSSISTNVQSSGSYVRR